MDFKTVADDLKSIRKELSDNLTARGITVNDTDGPTTLARKLALLNTTNTSLDSTEIYDSTVDLNGDCVKFRDYLASQLTAKGISVNDTDGPLTLAQKVNNILLTTNIVLTTDKTTLTSSDPKAHLEAKVTDLRDNPIPNVAVEFFVNGSSLSQSLTNENGIATYDYSDTVSGTFSLMAELGSVGIYNSSVSNTISITVKNYLFYDECTSNKISTNFGSCYPLESGIISSLSFDSTNNCYKVSNSGSAGQSMLPIPTLKGKTNFTLEAEFNAQTSSVYSQPNFSLYNPNTSGTGLVIGYWGNSYAHGYSFFNYTTSEIHHESCTIGTGWVKMLLVKSGTTITLKIYNSSGTLVYTKSYTIDSNFTGIGIGGAVYSSYPYLIRNIKAYSN